MAPQIDTAQQRAHFIDIMYNFAIHGIDEGEEAKVRSEIGVYFDRFSKQARRDALAEAVKVARARAKQYGERQMACPPNDPDMLIELGVRRKESMLIADAIDRLREGVKG